MSTPVTVPAGQMVAVNPTGQAAAITVRNTGAAVIYLTNTTNTNVSAALPLGPGSSQVWDAGKPLYIIGGSIASTALVFDNSGNLFDAAAVASALVASGLASAIASAITLSGVPSIDTPELLYTGVVHEYVASAPVIDVSRYQSLLFVTYAAVGSDPLPRAVQVEQQGDIYDPNSTVTHVFVAMPNNGVTVFRLPVIGNGLSFRVPATGVTVNLNMKVYGSYRSIPKPVWQGADSSLKMYNPTVVAALGGGTVVNTSDFFSWYAINPANATVPNYQIPIMRSGRAHLSAQINNAVGTFTYGVRDRVTGTWLVPLNAVTGGPVAGATGGCDFIIPNRPIDLYFVTSGITGGTGAVHLTITTES